MNEITAMLICLFLGGFTAYMDIASFFKLKRIGVAGILQQPAALSFLLGNALLAAAFLMWALSSPQAKINAVLPLDGVIAKGILIGVTVPALLRSRWFSVSSKEESGSSAAGIEAIYEWFRRRVLEQVNGRSIHQKEIIALRYARQLEGKAEVLEYLRRRVQAQLELFESVETFEEHLREYENYANYYAEDVASQDHLMEVIQWAMDATGIKFTKQRLEDFSARE